MVRSKSVMMHDDYVEKMADRKLGPEGTYLFPDATPIAPPLGYIKQPSITERIRDMVRSEHLRRAAEAAGAESFEEANDFEVGDDFDPSSPYEDEFDPANPNADLVPPVDPTGVPSPGGGEGAGGRVALPQGSVPAEPADGPEAVRTDPRSHSGQRSPSPRAPEGAGGVRGGQGAKTPDPPRL